MQAIPAIIGVVGAVVGAAGSLIGGSMQASAMQAQAAAQEAQAQQARQIAMYNAEMQRQNTMVAYQMAQAQAESAQNLAQFNQAVALSNANLAQFQAMGARQQYEQGLLNAQQKDIEAEAQRAQGREEQNRQRQENMLRVSALRNKYAASGVTFEGTPLEQLSEFAGLAELTAQDMAYATELESRKTIREAELTRWGAGFALIDEYGFKVQAQNYANQAIRYEYESNLAGYDSVIAGVQAKIGYNKAKLIELGGEADYRAGMFEASMTRYQAGAAMTTGMFGAASSALSGIGSAFGSYKPSSSGSLLGASMPSTASRAGAGYYIGGKYG